MSLSFFSQYLSQNFLDSSAFYGYSHDVKMFIYLTINYEWPWGYKNFILI